MLMLRGVVFSDVLRTTSGVGAGMPKLRGSVFGVALSGAGAAFAVAGGWATGGSRVAAPGVSDGWTALVDACEGVRETMVGTGVGFGAGRV
tara:strand:+ start:15075 stop:15347 length:273 start_codon:yes stop_codon:yes gene_type:complete